MQWLQLCTFSWVMPSSLAVYWRNNLPCTDKMKQLLKMTFVVNEHIDINAMSLCVDLNIF